MAPVREATFPEDLAATRRLFREYAGGLQINLSYQGFAEELDELPGRYAGPSGGVWLAVVSSSPVGCVALRPLGEGVCEVKRLYVRPEFRGTGLGRMLVERVLAAAGHLRVVLDTLPSMSGAVALYRSLGFAEVSAYCRSPIPDTLFLGRAVDFDDGAAPR